jgi:hypothetical protein
LSAPLIYYLLINKNMAGELSGLRKELREAVRKAWDAVDPDYSIRVALSDLVKDLVADAYKSCIRSVQKNKSAAACLAEVAKSKNLSKAIREYWRPVTATAATATA